MMPIPEGLHKLYTAADEAVAAWRQFQAGRLPEGDGRRLAMSLVLSEDVRRAVAAEAGPRPEPGFLARMARLTDRARLTPLLYLAAADAEVAQFLVRNPQAVEPLLREEGGGPPEDLWAFASRAAQGLDEFLDGVRWAAPALLLECRCDPGQAEAFLRYVHSPDTLDRLRERLAGGGNARAELTALAAEFRRASAPGPEARPTEVDVIELVVRKAGEALQLLKGVGAALAAGRGPELGTVRTRGASRAAAPVVVPIRRPGVDVEVTIRSAPPDAFAVRLHFTSAADRRAVSGCEVRVSAEGAAGESRRTGAAGAADFLLPAGRYEFACRPAPGAREFRLRLALVNGGHSEAD
jgi:hypothetical protein